MMLSRDESVNKAMRWFAENEQEYQCIEKDPESRFLNWKDEGGESGTASLVAEMKKTCEQMNIGLKLIGQEKFVKGEESEL
jgi:hypothetical protein